MTAPISRSPDDIVTVDTEPGAKHAVDAVSAQARIVELERQVAKLKKINAALINRVEQNTDHQGNSFSLFQTAILLEKQVGERTQELKQALAKLAQSNKKLSAAKEEADRAHSRLSEAIESLSEGFALFDAEDRLVLFNSKFLALFRSHEDLIRPNDTVFAELLHSAYDRGLLRHSQTAIAGWLESRLLIGVRAREPMIIALADGRWIQVSERLTQHGETVGLYTDVTEIKKSEAQRRQRDLEAKSLQLSATLDNLVQGVSVVDVNRRFAYWNERFLRLMGLPYQFVREGMAFEAIFDSEYIRKAFPSSTIEADLAKWSQPGSRHTVFRAEYHRRDGLVVEIQRKTMPDGGFVSTYTDVTDKRQAAKFLEDAKENLEKRVAERTHELTELNQQLLVAKSMADRANLSKTKFLAAASHDLLQPLNAARLFVSAIPDSEVSEEARRLVGRVNTALDSVDALLKALFDISKLDTGASKPEWSEFPVQGLLEALAREHAYPAEEKGLALKIVPCTAAIRSDRLLLRRILQNFIANAVRYTIAGRVLIGCRRKAGGLSIEVWDTGAGIPERHQDAIFDEFRRFIPPGAKTDSGFGLGLAIAQRSAKIIGCPIGFRSVPGKGSVFSVQVPFGRLTSVADHDKDIVSQRVAEAKNAAIVLIENDKDNLEGMTALLASWSYRVICARNARQAAVQIDERGLVPDLIIADYHLDHGSVGLDAIDQLRQHCGLPIPGFVITADHSTAVEEATKKAGLELLQKPIKPAEFRSLMGHTLA